METTMEAPATHRTVGFGPAFTQQFRLLWQSRKPLLLMAGLLGVLALAGEPWNDNPMARLFTVWPFWLIFIGPFWAFAVWHNEGPSNRLYFWSHPVSRTGHALARFAAGAAWLVTLFAALILTGALLAVFDGDIAQFGALTAAAWLNFFTGPLLGYVIISVLAVPSDYPIRWFLLLLLGIPFVFSLLDEWLGADRLVETLLKPLGEDWGIGPAILAPLALDINSLGDTLYRGQSRGGPDFDLAVWWTAMPLWLLFWVGLVVVLARIHPDRFPRLRRG